MTPEQAISSLNSQLAEHGQTVTLRKGNVANPSATVKAFVRGLQAQDLAGTTLTQSDKKVTISPTGLDAIGLPGASWQVVIDGAPLTVFGKPEIIRLADVVVRINMLVKG